MVILPVKVLVAVRTNVPEPDLVKPPEPERTSEIVKVTPNAGAYEYPLELISNPLIVPED